MRVSNNLALLLAAAAHASAQSTTSTAAPSSTITPSEPETGKLGDAAQVIDNPVGVVYKATLPKSAFFKPAYPDGDNIKGEVTAEANPDGLGVRFNIKLSNLPKTGDALPYHLHVDPVPVNGNCTATLAHLDPYIRGEATSCDKSAPETCQVGDLSGKHGAIPGDVDEWETSYVDLYASTVEGLGAFFGNRSIVFHYPNKTRITCASFEKVDGAASLPVSSSTASSTTISTRPTNIAGNNATAPAPTGAVPTTSRAVTAPTTTSVVIGAASSLRAGMLGAAVFGAAVAFML